MSEEELLEHGMNQSFTHVDFMVGTSDLSIEATLKMVKRFIFSRMVNTQVNLTNIH